ncbi:ATP-dependent helicase [Nitrospina watsonii]|uniref:DNA 3'-5' helicase n=1 Tax=Nitrospina watsonii TaxID=1323948 RepID=A0ABN8VWF1_9BACT|nr:ATP-dependent helicase [Nitrospina watsonii]CAI2717525.1 ATP-dependent DNA helicase UvrD/PcrA [Nitrospina watsonii]
MMVDLSSLNENQLNAVQWQEGPLLVLAGPGSGKTRVLTYRISRMIEESPDKHFRILGLTFTNKAAAEMRERIDALVPNAGERTLLTTFHSFCADLLRQHGHHQGLRPDFSILSQQADRQALLDEAIFKAGEKNNEVFYTGERLIPVITRLLDYSISIDKAETFLQSQNIREAPIISSFYSLYRQLMIEKNSLDFGGLISEALFLLEQKPSIKKQVHRIYPYICVDEFQDTNLSQYKILTHLVSPVTKNLFVVADDDQIIYQWNGANPERLKELQKDFEMKVLQLPENYRCPPEVIDIANKLISHNLNRSADKELLQANKSISKESPIHVHFFDEWEEEASWVAKDILKRHEKSLNKCVVLARTRRLLESIISVFEKNGVPSYLAMRKDEFVGAPMFWLHGVLRLANSRQDREQLRRICKSFYTLEGINLDVNDIMSQAATEDGDYLRAWQRAALQRSEISSETRLFLEQSIPKISDRLDFWKFLEDAFQWIDNLPESHPQNEEFFSEYKEEKETWDQLIMEIVAQYGRDQITLHLLLQELDLRSKAPKPPKHAVPCFTIHASKGMEFDHVYLVGLVEDQLPSWAAIKKGDDSHEMQEERRNCFVAITRTQESLSISYSSRVFGYTKEPSRFLKEMGLV